MLSLFKTCVGVLEIHLIAAFKATIAALHSEN